MVEEKGYRHLTALRVRFADLDVMGHLNSLATLELVETARVDYMVDLGLGRHNELTYAIVSLQCDFRDQAHYGDALTCGTRCPRLGRSSFALEHEVWKADGTTVLTAATILAHLSADDPTRATPIPDDWRETIERFQGAVG